MTAHLLSPLRARRIRFANPAGGLDDSSTVLGQQLRRPGLPVLLRPDAWAAARTHGQQIFGSHAQGEVAALLCLGHLGGLVPEGVWFEASRAVGSPGHVPG